LRNQAAISLEPKGIGLHRAERVAKNITNQRSLAPELDGIGILLGCGFCRRDCNSGSRRGGIDENVSWNTLRGQGGGRIGRINNAGPKKGTIVLPDTIFCAANCQALAQA
jgi:hypothetical protein